MLYKDVKFKSNFFLTKSENGLPIWYCANIDAVKIDSNELPLEFVWFRFSPELFGLAGYDNETIADKRVALYVKDFLSVMGDTEVAGLDRFSSGIRDKVLQLLPLIKNDEY